MVNTRGINTGGSARSHILPGNCLEIYYQNVRGLRTKQLKLYENIYCTDYNIICLGVTWLDDMCYDHTVYPDCYTVFRSDRASVSKISDGGVLIALSSRVRFCKRRYNLESCDECVLVEISFLKILNCPLETITFPPTLNLKSLIITFGI
jgi:hypothetical protein